jgi:DNA-binding MarR family transcriptional regulator
MDHRAEGDANLIVLIQAVQGMIEKRCHRFLSTRYGITFPQYRLLLATAKGNASTLGELAEDVNCTRGNLTGVTDRLERDGWLVRERNRDDRRVITLRLTAKGERIRSIQAELVEDLASLANVWTKEEREALSALLQRVVTNSPLAQAG